MIILTRLDGQMIALNGALVERVEASPDTVVTTVDGALYTVAESVEQVLDKLEHHHVAGMARYMASEQRPKPSLRSVYRGRRARWPELDEAASTVTTWYLMVIEEKGGRRGLSLVAGGGWRGSAGCC